MSGPDERPAIYGRWEDAFVAAVEDRAPAPAPPPGRRRRRVALGAVVAVGALASVAGATKLIGVGEPVKDRRPLPRDARPATPADVTSTVTEPSGVTWGVRLYTSAAGQRCVLGGRVRDGRLGLMVQGRFRPLAAANVGACGRLLGFGAVYAVQHPDDDLRRSLVIGRVDPARFAAVRVRIRPTGEIRRVRTDRQGGFLLVYDDASLTERDVRIRPLPG